MSEMFPDTFYGAILSDDGLYRYQLSRTWDWERPPMVWIMLNPSKADADVDDPTIRRCISFAKREGCGGIEVLNLYAFRSTHPKDLLKVSDPEGPGNSQAWDAVLRANADSPIVAAWGTARPTGCRPSRALIAYDDLLDTSKCLGRTADGSPRHPLYVRADAPLVPLVD
jgi:hypothetical protein